MSEKTEIAWTTSSWNPWIGCTEVSPGCDNCYARTLDKRHQYGGATHWGPGIPRYRTKQWNVPLKWNKKAAASGERWTVFPSLCDPFDNEVHPLWRLNLWDLIGATPALTWLLLTKRIGNARNMAPVDPFPNVWIGASIVNQEEADRDIPKLLATPAAKRFVSYEPALAQVTWRPEWFAPQFMDATGPKRRIGWVIVGGESSQGGATARTFDIEWARSTVAQCKAAGVPVFVKQMGSRAYLEQPSLRKNFPVRYLPKHSDDELAQAWIGFKDRAGADPVEWPEDLRVQEFPA